MTTSAILIIDLQADLCNDPRRREIVAGVLPNIFRLADTAETLGGLVVYTQFVLDRDDPQFKRFGDVYCVRGTSGAELIPGAAARARNVLEKHKHSAFADTHLDDLLRRHAVERLVLAGLQTQICVLTTAADAYHRGYDVIVASDAVASTREEVRLEAVDWINKYVGRARTVEEILSCEI